MGTSSVGLRERKKRRTQQTIIETAVRLFSERGYRDTTLVEIATAAEIAPSTFFNYFHSKTEVVFGVFDAVLESALDRLVDRPGDESAVEAILDWVAHVLPDVEGPYKTALRALPAIVAAEDELQSEERLRFARLEDVVAEAFARDFREPPSGLRSRVMSLIAVHGMTQVWTAWYQQHHGDADFDPAEVFALKTDYLRKALNAGLACGCRKSRSGLSAGVDAS